MVQINQELCVSCGLCIKDCVEQNLKNKKGVITVLNSCMECGHCVAICPQNAVSLEGYDMSQVESVSPGKSLNADDLLYAIKARRSIRQFKDQKISDEQLTKICDAVRYTATAKNLQDTTLVVVQDKMKEFEDEVYGYLEEMFEGCDVHALDQSMAALWMFTMRHKRERTDDFLLRQAPAVIIIASNRPWDSGMAAQNIELMAGAHGLGVLFNGYLSRLIDSSAKLKSWLGIEGKTVSSVMLVGEPNVKYQRTVPRKELDVIRR